MITLSRDQVVAEIEAGDLVHHAIAAVGDMARFRGHVLLFGYPLIISVAAGDTAQDLTEQVATKRSHIRVALQKRDEVRAFLEVRKWKSLMPSRAPTRKVEFVVLGDDGCVRGALAPDPERLDRFITERDRYVAALGWDAAKACASPPRRARKRRAAKSPAHATRRDDRSTFTDLGISFSLFEAPVTNSTLESRQRCCTVCQKRGRVLRLGPADVVTLVCTDCDARTEVGAGLLGEQGGDWDCGGCDETHTASLFGEDEVALCCECLSEGRGEIGHETNRPIRTKRDRKELARTPSFLAWQGTIWLVCCRAPMVFLGRWGRAEFEADRADSGREYFLATVENSRDPADLYDRLPEHVGPHDTLSTYVFRCRSCSRLRGRWDSA